MPPFRLCVLVAAGAPADGLYFPCSTGCCHSPTHQTALCSPMPPVFLLCVHHDLSLYSPVLYLVPVDTAGKKSFIFSDCREVNTHHRVECSKAFFPTPMISRDKKSDETISRAIRTSSIMDYCWTENVLWYSHLIIDFFSIVSESSLDFIIWSANWCWENF